MYALSPSGEYVKDLNIETNVDAKNIITRSKNDAEYIFKFHFFVSVSFLMNAVAALAGNFGFNTKQTTKTKTLFKTDNSASAAKTKNALPIIINPVMSETKLNSSNVVLVLIFLKKLSNIKLPIDNDAPKYPPKTNI